jgi:hypothetical protein
MDDNVIGRINSTLLEYEQNPARRDAILGSVTRSESEDLYQYANYAATYAVRLNAPELLRRGVLALAIENSTLDYRDVIGRLSLLNHSAKKLGVRFDRVFHEVMPLAPARFASTLEGFIQRSCEDRAIGKFGFQEEYIPLFTYTRIPTSSYLKLSLRFRLKRMLKRFIPFL